MEQASWTRRIYSYLQNAGLFHVFVALVGRHGAIALIASPFHHQPWPYFSPLAPPNSGAHRNYFTILQISVTVIIDLQSDMGFL